MANMHSKCSWQSGCHDARLAADTPQAFSAQPSHALSFTAHFQLSLLLQVATYVGFAAELYAWFCIGEIVGRGGSLTGYNV
jgi:hypothetical protein